MNGTVPIIIDDATSINIRMPPGLFSQDTSDKDVYKCENKKIKQVTINGVPCALDPSVAGQKTVVEIYYDDAT